MPKRIAIVEDEIAIAQNYCDALSRQGYDVSHYRSRPEAMTAFTVRLPDLAIIDVGLGDELEGGFDLCRDLRVKAPVLPIIFLTARDTELERVLGLRLGTDDYLTKDISQVHMLARITALFRRVDALSAPQQKSQWLECGSLQIDTQTLRVNWARHPIELTITEYWVVLALASQPGHVKTRQQLMDAANVVLDDNTITSHIKRIRKKFKVADDAFDAIQTVYGLGYRWLPSNS
ncbi:proteobacterial dedicated sortase system response regulator [Marinagarivorans algicola]|uniref:proteobacterial dedicated sortase system response regulator n=1 Tax=Marinagarivorans algicola TaxID=1513270 RepID=UPI0006B97FFD|nr:proteobacterial dedicated sortase system response regulator [Marinagarivorans algicola]